MLKFNSVTRRLDCLWLAKSLWLTNLHMDRDRLDGLGENGLCLVIEKCNIMPKQLSPIAPASKLLRRRIFKLRVMGMCACVCVRCGLSNSKASWLPERHSTTCKPTQVLVSQLCLVPLPHSDWPCGQAMQGLSNSEALHIQCWNCHTFPH